MTACSTFRRVFTSLAFALCVTALVGCRLITPAELDQYGTKTYEGRSKGQVMRAVIASLRSQGYDIASEDDDAGHVKTGPKVVVVTAASTGYGTAAAQAGELAWTIDVEAKSSGAVVHAMPRGYQGGQAIEATKFNYDYARKAFATLFSEIDSELPRAGSAALTNGKVAADQKTFTESKTVLKKTKKSPATPATAPAPAASSP
jgi:hypothetical protein